MELRFRSLNLATFFCLVLIGTLVLKSAALVTTQDSNPPYPKAISDLKEAIVKGLGFQAEEFKISGFDLRDAQVGKSVAYEFDVEIDNKVMPFKLLEDVNRWEYVDLPIFQTAHSVRPGEENGLVDSKKFDDNMPVLAPFQLAGPMELWIQDAKDMRISLPHEVDAGVLKKVVLADGAVVTVKGARSVSLRHPIELPLPFNRTSNNFASGLLTLAEWLRNAVQSQDGPLLSLRIVGPTSLTSPASSSSSSNNRLKLKRLAPGLVELSSVSKRKSMKASSTAIDLHGEATALLAPDRFSTLWPITSIDGYNSNLLGFEALLSSVLGPKASKEGSFKLLKADVSAQTVVKMGFVVEKKTGQGDGFDISGFPEWRTKPQSVRMHFEVLGKVEGNKVVPERVVQINPVMGEDTVAENVVTGNTSMSKVPVVYQPPTPFAL
ncbi:protein TUNICAMYCIN INDUCED 1-like [Salvia miltiorrhiza]|uniref:protein TUNICAMYCIN INDUCED 1-like n=1 Tax=Salvia miltiorrhiza TaxID=226208 RepID=UPI0025ABBAB8|nr:protein TUNICAMYCIN INDUCED 1-like [Salvia miltiorrhiza]